MQQPMQWLAKENTFNAVPSLWERLSRVTKRIPYLGDFTSTHFLSSWKFSSNESGWLPSSVDCSLSTSFLAPPVPASKAENLSTSFDNIHQVKSANFYSIEKITICYNYHNGKITTDSFDIFSRSIMHE